MTKEVLVKVSGMQFDVEDEAIELSIVGTYYFKNGKHYVFYEEQPDDAGSVIKNTVKFSEDMFEITKKGDVQSCLLFDKNKTTSSMYQTPIGPLQIDVVTETLLLEETEQELHVNVKYSLDINYHFVSNCEVDFRVLARA